MANFLLQTRGDDELKKMKTKNFTTYQQSCEVKQKPTKFIIKDTKIKGPSSHIRTVIQQELSLGRHFPINNWTGQKRIQFTRLAANLG